MLTSKDETEIEWNFISNILQSPFKINRNLNILVTDVIPTFVAFSFTAAVIYMNGYVGVLDLDNMQEMLVMKQQGGQIRTNLEQMIYDLDNEDADRKLGKQKDTEKRVTITKKISTKTPKLWCKCGD